jgi:hypothetical protein
VLVEGVDILCLVSLHISQEPRAVLQRDALTQ